MTIHSIPVDQTQPDSISARSQLVLALDGDQYHLSEIFWLQYCQYFNRNKFILQNIVYKFVSSLTDYQECLFVNYSQVVDPACS